MWDAIFLGAGAAFFAAAIGYALICERLCWAAIMVWPRWSRRRSLSISSMP